MWLYIKSNLNFYRIHVFLFFLIPLLASVIFWGSNGKFKIEFIDALFVCVSAATGTGLSTIDLSSLTAWQQSIIVILELFGNQVFVSWLVVYFRRLYFLEHLEHIVQAELERRSKPDNARGGNESAPPSLPVNFALREPPHESVQLDSVANCASRARSKPSTRDFSSRIRPDMVRRVDREPHLVDPTGRSESQDGGYVTGFQSSSRAGVSQYSDLRNRNNSMHISSLIERDASGYFGGFPGPQEILKKVTGRMFPQLHRTVQRTMTMPRTATLIPRTASNSMPVTAGPAKQVTYISFGTTVGRNSVFKQLTKENIEELGGVEYRALSALLWIVPLYYLGILVISALVIAPYMGLPRWHNIFLPPEQHRKINTLWFSVFQVVGAWANTGMSLVDQNMIPFRTAYPMIVFLVICVLAGNTAYPIFLRFMIWGLMKLLPTHSRTKEALQFLLDHPRRCFILLFPSSQTWLLLAVQLSIDLVAWGFDLVLNIGNPATDMIPVGVRIINAVLQTAAVRSAGFQSISVASFVPAVQVLYVILMYIAIYPIAISVRSTNVYEERSLGIYEKDESEDDDNIDDVGQITAESRVMIWGRYLYHHERALTSGLNLTDMWWLALSLFLLCIIERDPLMNTQNATWFTIFALIFESVSAYGTVGLSLGVPYANYSFSGALHTLSKLVMCAIMIRGRHRGLPVALDRAVLLPHEFRRKEDAISQRPHEIEATQPTDQQSNLDEGKSVRMQEAPSAAEPKIEICRRR